MLNWHWIFLVNVPIGIAVVAALAAAAAGRACAPGLRAQLDVGGAVTVTASLMLAVYAIVNGNQSGWTSGADARPARPSPPCCFGVFLVIESRVASPLMPLRLFKLRNVATANVVGVLWAAAMFAWFFLSALYLQLVLGYSPLEVGLAFLPANLIMGALLDRALGEARHALRHQAAARDGPGCWPALGLLLFARAPVDGTYVVDVLPSMILLGLGAGIAFNPVLLAAMSDVEPRRGRARLGRRQHGVHDGRRARAGRAREPRRVAHGQPRWPRASRRARGAHRRLPRRVPGRRAVRRSRPPRSAGCCSGIQPMAPHGAPEPAAESV